MTIRILSVCMRDNQDWNPIGKALVIRNLSFRLLQEELTPCYAKLSGATVKWFDENNRVALITHSVNRPKHTCTCSHRTANDLC